MTTTAADAAQSASTSNTTAVSPALTSLSKRVKEAALAESGIFGVAILGGLIAQAAYAYGVAENAALTFAMTNAYALASVMAGGLLGFLFGVPRFTTSTGERESTITPHTALPNTNLEQISDWLTKILVGVGLVQVKEIWTASQQLFESLGAALGTGGSAVAFSGSLVVYATALGFMFGWLGTRTWVARLVTAPDTDRDHSGQ